MIEWLGISHLFEPSQTGAILGFLTPLAIFIAFFLAQLILPDARDRSWYEGPRLMVAISAYG